MGRLASRTLSSRVGAKGGLQEVRYFKRPKGCLNCLMFFNATLGWWLCPLVFFWTMSNLLGAVQRCWNTNKADQDARRQKIVFVGLSDHTGSSSCACLRLMLLTCHVQFWFATKCYGNLIRCPDYGHVNTDHGSDGFVSKWLFRLRYHKRIPSSK